jgi:hypothetical protein
LSRLLEIFEDEMLVNKIKKRLPYLFQLAELESSRAGKVGMKVGSLREKILVALLIYKFEEKMLTRKFLSQLQRLMRDCLDNPSPSELSQGWEALKLHGLSTLKKQESSVKAIPLNAISCLLKLNGMKWASSPTYLLKFNRKFLKVWGEKGILSFQKQGQTREGLKLVKKL